LHSPDITIQQVSAKMYRANADFVFTVTRDFLRACQTPILILPDDIPPHPYAVAMEGAMLAPNAQVSIYPGKDVSEKIPLAVRHIRTFLQANRPVTAAVEQRAAAECVILGREFVPFVTLKCGRVLDQGSRRATHLLRLPRRAPGNMALLRAGSERPNGR
jgi:hypothetical protein